MSHSRLISDLNIHFTGYGPLVLKNIKERPAITGYSWMDQTDTDPNCLIQFVYMVNIIQIQQIELYLFQDVLIKYVLFGNCLNLILNIKKNLL